MSSTTLNHIKKGLRKRHARLLRRVISICLQVNSRIKLIHSYRLAKQSRKPRFTIISFISLKHPHRKGERYQHISESNTWFTRAMSEPAIKNYVWTRLILSCIPLSFHNKLLQRKSWKNKGKIKTAKKTEKVYARKSLSKPRANTRQKSLSSLFS